MARVVVITGVSRHLGSRMARILSRETSIDRVIGVDIVPPREDIGGAEFFRADIRNPVISKVLVSTGADTVVHMGVISTPVQAGGRSTMKEINVIGTMQLLAACQRTPSVSSLVVKSTAAVYGSGAKDPALFTEDMEPRRPPRTGYAKDKILHVATAQSGGRSSNQNRWNPNRCQANRCNRRKRVLDEVVDSAASNTPNLVEHIADKTTNVLYSIPSPTNWIPHY